MNTKQLVRKVAKMTNTTIIDSKIYLEVILEVIKNGVAEDGKVMLTDFGTFVKATINENGRIGTNPQTGEKIEISPTLSPKFKAGKDFKKRVRNS